MTFVYASILNESRILQGKNKLREHVQQGRRRDLGKNMYDTYCT